MLQAYGREFGRPVFSVQSPNQKSPHIQRRFMFKLHGQGIGADNQTFEDELDFNIPEIESIFDKSKQ